jgi:hypothetical protein
MLSMSFLKSFFPVLIPIFIVFSGCQNSFYTVEDYSSVKKIDSHIHINSDKGYFEEQAIEDNFILITLGVDHGDSANIRRQQANATFSTTKYPGRVFSGPTFLFDTAGWGTETWSRNIITGLENDLSGGGITVNMEKYRDDFTGQIRQIHNGRSSRIGSCH